MKKGVMGNVLLMQPLKSRHQINYPRLEQRILYLELDTSEIRFHKIKKIPGQRRTNVLVT